MRIHDTAHAAAAIAASLTFAATAASAQTPSASADTGAAVLANQAPAAAPAERRFTLVEVGGKALPVQVDKEWRCREEVTAGTLVLRGDGRWRLGTSIRETCGDRTKMDQEDEDGLYRTEGGTIQFLDDDGNRNDDDWHVLPEIDLDELDQGSIADGGTLTVRLADEKTVLKFKEQGS